MSKAPRTEPLRSYPEDAETPAPVPVAPEAPTAGVEPVTQGFYFEGGKAFACDEGGKMVQVDFDQAAAAANHIVNASDPAAMKRAAASCAAQFPVKAPGTTP